MDKQKIIDWIDKREKDLRSSINSGGLEDFVIEISLTPLTALRTAIKQGEFD